MLWPTLTRGAEMHHRLRPQHERFEYRSIPHVTFDIFRLRARVTRPRAGAVDLRFQVVEHRHTIVAPNECVDEVRTDIAAPPVTRMFLIAMRN